MYTTDTFCKKKSVKTANSALSRVRNILHPAIWGRHCQLRWSTQISKDEYKVASSRHSPHPFLTKPSSPASLYPPLFSSLAHSTLFWLCGTSHPLSVKKVGVKGGGPRVLDLDPFSKLFPPPQPTQCPKKDKKDKQKHSEVLLYDYSAKKCR